jgi:hypothetical protein
MNYGTDDKINSKFYAEALGVSLQYLSLKRCPQTVRCNATWYPFPDHKEVPELLRLFFLSKFGFIFYLI